MLNPPDLVVLIDDIITRGTQMLAAAEVIRSAWPGTTIRAFAAMRTISNTADFNKILAPVVGTVTRVGDFGRREP